MFQINHTPILSDIPLFFVILQIYIVLLKNTMKTPAEFSNINLPFPFTLKIMLIQQNILIVNIIWLFSNQLCYLL